MRAAPLLHTCLLVLSALGGCRDAGVRALDELRVVDSVYVDPETDRPYTGRIERRFEADSTSVQIAARLRDGVWDGEMTVYHPNGRIRYMGSFRGGDRCGPWIENADSVSDLGAFEDLVREIESMGLYPPCDDAS